MNDFRSIGSIEGQSIRGIAPQGPTEGGLVRLLG